MGLIAVIAAAAALVWAAIYARRGTLLTSCTAFVILGYVLPHAFWHANVGVATLTIDRVALVGLIVMLLCHWQWAKLASRNLATCDWILGALLLYLTIRCALTPPAGDFRTVVGPWWRIITSFWMPAILYAVVRVAPLNERTWRWTLLGLSGLGGYLAFTAIAEVNGQWWAIFPRFISDSSLGTHFGRARGPALMSASLGVYLTASFWAAWFAWARASRLVRAALIAVMLAMVAGIYYTYTRSTWLGIAGGLAIIPILQMPRRWRLPVALGCLLVGAAGLAAFGPKLTNLGRKDADGSAAHSVYQRASFAYVSLRMFRDAPLFGCGVSRFYDKKLPYLSDRNQQIELESIRNLDHHNTLLSVLVETGLVGFSLFVALLVTWTKSAWDVFRRAETGSWKRAQGLFALAVMIAYLATAVFHDLTLSATEHWLLFLSSGLSVALLTERKRSAPIVAPAALLTGIAQRVSRLTPKRQATAQRVRPTHVHLFGMTIDSLDMPETVGKVLAWCAAPWNGRCKYVVTPNVDHAVMYQSNRALRAAYEDAALVLADGAPVVLASRLLNKALPERVAGSDLAPALFKRASKTRRPDTKPKRLLRVFLLGAAPGVAERAKANIEAKWIGVEVAGTMSPPLGFEHDDAENQRIFAAIAAVKPDLLVIGLGAPKQELWVSRHADRLEAKVALCVGATIDFLAGARQRAPRWVRRMGLEWMHRLASEPGRLAKRYVRDAWAFPQLVWRDWHGGHQARWPKSHSQSQSH